MAPELKRAICLLFSRADGLSPQLCTKNGEPRMTAEMFRGYVAKEILPEVAVTKTDIAIPLSSPSSPRCQKTVLGPARSPFALRHPGLTSWGVNNATPGRACTSTGLPVEPVIFCVTRKDMYIRVRVESFANSVRAAVVIARKAGDSQAGFPGRRGCVTGRRGFPMSTVTSRYTTYIVCSLFFLSSDRCR